MSANGDRITFWGNENVLELGRGEGSMTEYTKIKTTECTL